MKLGVSGSWMHQDRTKKRVLMTEWYTASVTCCLLGQVLGALTYGGFYGRRLRALLPLVWDEEYFQKETICILIFFIVVPLLGKKNKKQN